MAFATIIISQDGVYAGTGRLIRHDDGVTIEDCSAVLGPDGLDHESGEAQDAADRAYEVIERAIAAGESTVTVDGCTYTWQIEDDPEPEVLGLGDEDWTHDDEREWMRYGTVRVRLGEVEYQVGVAIGVPEYLRATAEAAGGDTTRPAYLSAWYIDQSDWSCARASEGRNGIPQGRDRDVLDAVNDAVVRLWREYEQEQAVA
ncbi:MAG TPA: hypothetical protein VF188_00905 [Longimicrobiales bacterium]